MIRAVLALALVTAPAAAQAQPATITLDEARAMPVSELAHRVLGLVGDPIREVRIDSDQAFWPADNGKVLKTIYLATPAERAGPRGMCSATLYEVQFEPAGPPRADGQQPVSFVRMFNRPVYKVVAGIESPGRIDDSSHIDRDEALCARTAPVLWQLKPGRVPGFFSGRSGDRYELTRQEAWFVARTLRAAQRWHGPLTCSGDGAMCADPYAALATGLFWSAGYYELRDCRDRPGTLCVRAYYELGHGTRSVTLDIATATRQPDDSAPVRIRTLTLTGQGRD